MLQQDVNLPPEQPQVVIERVVERTPLFVLCDAGETKAFIPVMKQLERDKKPFQAVVMGTASQLVDPDEFPGKVLSLQALVVEDVVDSVWLKQNVLSKQSLDSLKKRLKPSIILSGVVTGVQEQFFNLFPRVKKIAYADKFYYTANLSELDMAVSVAKNADLILASTALSKEALQKRLPDSYIEVIGQPAIEAWHERILEIKQNPKEKRRLIRKIVPEESDAPLVTIAHGSGDHEGPIAKLFKEMEVVLKSKGFIVHIQPHPKYGPTDITLEEAVAISDFIISFDSSAGFLSLLSNKKVIFAVPPELEYSNFAIDMGFGPKVTSAKELPSAIRLIEHLPIADFHKKLGMPEDSCERFISLLDKNS